MNAILIDVRARARTSIIRMKKNNEISQRRSSRRFHDIARSSYVLTREAGITIVRKWSTHHPTRKMLYK